MRYAKPKSVDEALGLMAERPWRLLAGGTDFYPAQGAKPIRDDVLDINGLADLRGIDACEDYVTLGARTTWTDIAKADLPPSFLALKQAAREIGGVQIQNMGTLAGNLCNASPAADGLPPLMILDAEVELRSAAATRRLSLPEFILGNRKTARRPNELMTAIRIPKSSARGASRFVKLGARRYLVISIAMAAARIVVTDGRIEKASVALGACSEVAQRLSLLERALSGTCVSTPLSNTIRPLHFAGLSPISDVRGTADYRFAAMQEVVIRAIEAAIAAASHADDAAGIAA